MCQANNPSLNFMIEESCSASTKWKQMALIPAGMVGRDCNTKSDCNTYCRLSPSATQCSAAKLCTDLLLLFEDNNDCNHVLLGRKPLKGSLTDLFLWNHTIAVQRISILFKFHLPPSPALGAGSTHHDCYKTVNPTRQHEAEGGKKQNN